MYLKNTDRLSWKHKHSSQKNLYRKDFLSGLWLFSSIHGEWIYFESLTSWIAASYNSTYLAFSDKQPGAKNWWSLKYPPLSKWIPDIQPSSLLIVISCIGVYILRTHFSSILFKCEFYILNLYGGSSTLGPCLTWYTDWASWPSICLNSGQRRLSVRISLQQTEPGRAGECNGANQCPFVCIWMHYFSHIRTAHEERASERLHTSSDVQRIPICSEAVAFRLICTDTFCLALLLTDFFLLEHQGQASVPE